MHDQRRQTSAVLMELEANDSNHDSNSIERGLKHRLQHITCNINYALKLFNFI